jgi:hypothetical protein
MEKRMLIRGIKCKKCNDVIYSRCRHDFHWCSCKSCAIDGGFDYLRIMGHDGDWEQTEINVLDGKSETEVKKILYNDWNKRKNKYGTIVERN